MARPIKIKINVTRILTEYLFEGKNGKYLDLVAWPNAKTALVNTVTRISLFKTCHARHATQASKAQSLAT